MPKFSPENIPTPETPQATRVMLAFLLALGGCAHNSSEAMQVKPVKAGSHVHRTSSNPGPAPKPVDPIDAKIQSIRACYYNDV